MFPFFNPVTTVVNVDTVPPPIASAKPSSSTIEVNSPNVSGVANISPPDKLLICSSVIPD